MYYGSILSQKGTKKYWEFPNIFLSIFDSKTIHSGMGRIIGEITGGLGGRLQMDICIYRDTFSSNHTFIKVRLAFDFELQTL